MLFAQKHKVSLCKLFSLILFVQSNLLYLCEGNFSGPWSVGEIIEGYTGIIFAWGTIINGSYLPGSFTYAYGFLQVC